MSTTTEDTSVYFANLRGTNLAAAVCRRIDTFQSFCTSTGLYALWLKSYQQYYGMGRNGFSSHEVRRHGDSSEFLKVSINHFRSLLTHLLTLSTGTRKALEPVATSDTYESEQEVRLAKGVLEFAMRQGLEAAIQQAEEYAVVLGRGYVGQTWDATAGDMLAPSGDGQAALHTGNLETHVFMPQDVAFDVEARSGEVPWVCTRRRVNRHDLLAALQGVDEELAEMIRTLSSHRRNKECDFRESVFVTGTQLKDQDDQVVLWEFWHERTPACPMGRHAQFLGEDVLLFSEDLPYESVPLRGLSPAFIMSTPFGYTNAWDLLAPQEMVDTLKSIELTSQATHGMGLVAVAKGSGVDTTMVARGLTLIEYNPGTQEPRGIQLGALDTNVIGNQQRTVQDMETLSGVNSVVRGQPEASLKSGSALALVQAQAVQASILFQTADTKFTEGLGDDCLSIFTAYATEPLKMEVEGADGYLVTNEVRGADLKMVKRVRVDVGNPLTRTIAGKVQLADSLVQAQLIKDPMQYIRVIETGRLEPITEHESRERANIKAENEMLARARFQKDPATGETVKKPQVDPATGVPTGKWEEVLDEKTLPVALKTDNPYLHVQQHATVLADPRVRTNPAMVRAVLAHIQAHQQQYAAATTGDPGLLELMGIPPSAAAMASMGAMPGAQAPAAEGPSQQPQGQSGGPGGASRVLAPGQQDPKLPNLPKLPPGAASATGTNPAAPGPTGQA